MVYRYLEARLDPNHSVVHPFRSEGVCLSVSIGVHLWLENFSNCILPALGEGQG